MITEPQIQRLKMYCREPIENIKGYKESIDSQDRYVCHHINELTFTRAELIKMNMYYNRPASELVLLTVLEHVHLHGRPDMPSSISRSGKLRGRMREEACAWKGSDATGSAKYKRGRKLFKFGLISKEEFDNYRKFQQEYKRARRNKDG
jgi:hypothetical protein